MGKQGIILIDKPEGITSRKALDRVMAILKAKRAGHFGTLDPFATGLLCIGVGQGTKLLPFMHAHEKEYVATIGFDMCTDTDDVTGTPMESFYNVSIDIDKALAWFDKNKGWIDQLPPRYCAQKINGKPLYKLTRANQEVEPRSKQVFIEHTEVLDYGPDWINARIICSRGTYIRSIARDLGAYLGYGGYLRELRRFRSEGFHLDDAMTIDTLGEKVSKGEDVVIPLSSALHIPKVRVTRTGESGILDGNPIQVSWLLDEVDVSQGSYVAVLNTDMRLLCVARSQPCAGIWGYIERGFRPY
ncbi:MAG: tRNA pseudouridine(55) synthase TruB [Deltaproteobacteria bacterium]|nr:tRNA pseudouridine(55) synthase TruB [Deltaproteobacteria bacterium]